MTKQWSLLNMSRVGFLTRPVPNSSSSRIRQTGWVWIRILFRSPSRVFLRRQNKVKNTIVVLIFCSSYIGWLPAVEADWLLVVPGDDNCSSNCSLDFFVGGEAFEVFEELLLVFCSMMLILYRFWLKFRGQLVTNAFVIRLTSPSGKP